MFTPIWGRFPKLTNIFSDGLKETTNQKKWILQKPKSSKKTLGWWKIQKKIPWIPPFSWTCWSKTCAMFALFQKSEDVCGGENPWRLWDLSEKCSRTKKMWQKVCRNLCWINERFVATKWPKLWFNWLTDQNDYGFSAKRRFWKITCFLSTKTVMF